MNIALVDFKHGSTRVLAHAAIELYIYNLYVYFAGGKQVACGSMCYIYLFPLYKTRTRQVDLSTYLSNISEYEYLCTNSFAKNLFEINQKLA